MEIRAETLSPPERDLGLERRHTAPTAATRYATMSDSACIAELDARRIPYDRAERAGVATPVRLRGPLSGVVFRTLMPDQLRARWPYEICDCRLVLAMDDFAKLLARRGIDDVMYFSAFRPLAPGQDAALRGHYAGLAIDIAYFGARKRNPCNVDGATPQACSPGGLNVERHFLPREHERVCAPGKPPVDSTPAWSELRRIACDASEEGLFHVVLTPDYDEAHFDHFHLEIASATVPHATSFVLK